MQESIYRQGNWRVITIRRLLAVAVCLAACFYILGAAMALATEPTAVPVATLSGQQQEATPTTGAAIVTDTTPITPTATLAPMVITAVEPARISTVTGGTLTVLGSGFTPDTVIRLIGYGLLNTTFINHNALTGVVPPGVLPGRYDVQVGVGQPGGVSAVQPDALLIEAPPEPTHTPAPTHTPVPTPTPTATPTAVFIFGQPQLTIQTVRTTPELLQPGEPFDLLLEIANQGNWTAVEASIEMQSADLAVPASGSNVRVLSRIGPNGVVTTTMSLIVSETAPKGAQNVAFHLTYFDVNGRSYSSQQSVGLFIGEAAPTPTPTPDAAQAQLLLTTYATEPEATLQPGAIFDLVLTLTNVGDLPTCNVIMRLGGEGGQALEPFVLLNSGNVRFIESLDAGQMVQVTQTMLVAGTAAAGVYNLPIAFTYGDGQQPEQADSQIINLLVQRPPLLQVNFYRPTGPGMVGQPLDLPVEVVNIGRSLINVSNVILSSPDADIENNTVYIGPLDGGTSGSLDGRIVPSIGGELPIQVTVNYLDDFNQPQSYETTLTVLVQEPVAPPGAPPGIEPGERNNGQEGFLGLLWRFLRGLLGLGS